jgi:beta-glucosidase
LVAHPFPQNFVWGVATSAPQIEGATDEGGKGDSIWDRFATRPGQIEDGSTPSVACDHYRRWREDVRLLGWLGLGAYRFSVAWPRVVPAGRGAVNHAGLGFYDQLVDALLDAGIQPFATLYHWDLPQALQDRGGWGARDTAHAFAEYAAVVAKRLGDRVRHWITHNEPWCVATLGHEKGEHAPGVCDPALALRVAHHLLLSHALAMEAVHAHAPRAEVGITLNLTPASPASASEADRDAARQFDGAFNRWYLDPLFRARYPEDVIADRSRRGHLQGSTLPAVLEGDLRRIAAPMDFLGVNYYSRVVVRRGATGEPVAVRVVPLEELTAMGWEVFPQGLHRLLVRIDREYGPRQIYVTENGIALPDAVEDGARVLDPRRSEFLQQHFRAAHRALADGVPLRGYFVWSLLDNFEWAHGYTKRFGLVHVDFATQQRIPKDSAFWYRDVVAANAVHDGAPLSTRGGFHDPEP